VSKLRKTITPADVTVIIDTREQTPLDVSPLRSVTGTLATADYSIMGLEHMVAVERKSLPDFLACVGKERERFERECQRMLAYECRAIVVEATWRDIEAGEWLLRNRSKVSPQAALGSALGWIAQGIPVVMAGTHDRASQFVSRLLFTAARRRWRELQSFGESLRLVTGDSNERLLQSDLDGQPRQGSRDQEDAVG
jgi:ERCC4-type nuclease